MDTREEVRVEALTEDDLAALVLALLCDNDQVTTIEQAVSVATWAGELLVAQRERIVAQMEAWRPDPVRNEEPGHWKRGVRHARVKLLSIARGT